MAKSLNQVTLMGNLTRDPELVDAGGSQVAHFSVALNRSYKGADGQYQEATDYVDISAWANLAKQVSERLHKGSRVLVNGRLQSRSWEQDGVKKNKLEVVATDVTFLDAPSEV